MKDKIKKLHFRYSNYQKQAATYYGLFLSGKIDGEQLADKYLLLMSMSNEYTCCQIRNETAEISNFATSLDRSLHRYITNHLPKKAAL